MNEQIRIGKTYIQQKDAQSRPCALIRIGGKESVLWFGVSKEQESALSIGRSDPFVVALLPAAMRQRADIICEDPMSARLHHQLFYDLMPALARSGDLFHAVGIHAPVTSVPYPSQNAVATGFSGGVDSLYSIYRHGPGSEFPLTYLTVYNSGAFEGEKYRLGFERACRMCDRFAGQYGYSTVYVDSNVYELLPENYIEVCTWRLIACTLAIQGLVSVYLLASGYSISDFCFNEYHSASYDPLSISCACTETVQFYEAGVQTRRGDKIRELSEWPVSYDWLHPCIFGKAGQKNCGKCRKCMRSLAVLYGLGKLDEYRQVFDVDDYRKNLPLRLGFALSYEEDTFHGEVAELLKESAAPIPPLAFKCAEMFRNAKKVQDELGKASEISGKGAADQYMEIEQK